MATSSTPDECSANPMTGGSAAGVSRRGVIRGTTFGALGTLLAGTGSVGVLPNAAAAPEKAEAPFSGSTSATDSVQAVKIAGLTQAGVTRPVTPQSHALVVIADIDLGDPAQLLADLGTSILLLTSAPVLDIFPDGVKDLSVTVGIGPRVLNILHPAKAAEQLLDLPLFAGDENIDPSLRGGDLLLSFNCSDPQVLEPAYRVLREKIAGFAPRWSVFGFRGAGIGGIARNPFGYHDGVIVPRSLAEQLRDVWIQDEPLRGSTVCVLRRCLLDTEAFAAQPTERQDAIMGREKVSGAPLSGGALKDQVNVAARGVDGEPVIALDSHVRAAHPSFTGSGLMLRRSYGFLEGTSHGMLFTAFQKEISTFIRTQQRMDDMDALLNFVRVTASAAFLILPGYGAERSLGASLTQ